MARKCITHTQFTPIHHAAANTENKADPFFDVWDAPESFFCTNVSTNWIAVKEPITAMNRDRIMKKGFHDAAAGVTCLELNSNAIAVKEECWQVAFLEGRSFE